MKVRAGKLLLVCVAVGLMTAGAAGQTTQGGEGGIGVGLPVRVAWLEGDHASGVYHPAEAGKFTVAIENAGESKGQLKGTIEFGMLEAGAGGFKVIAVIPVTPTSMEVGERAKVGVEVTFGNVGTYGFRWMDEAGKKLAIGNPAGEVLQCIFAPRGGGTSGSDGRWLGMLPAEVGRVPGYLADLAQQTGVRKYLLDERFSFDEKTGLSLGVGASLGVSGEQVKRMFEEARQAKIQIILRVTVPMKGASTKSLEAFHGYVADAAHQAGGCLGGLVIVPEEATETDAANFRAFYLAGYQAAKAVDKGILMLGAGDASLTGRWILSAGLSAYLDGMAMTDVSVQPGVAAGETKLPTWLLPPVVFGEGAMAAERWALVPAAVGLAEGAAVVTVPPPEMNRGVVEHLLGGAAFYQKLHGAGTGSEEALPYVASFQGDGFAVAVVGGLGAGTPVDEAYRALANTRTTVAPAAEDDLPAYANMEVGDDGGGMRVVDRAGAPVDCRRYDTLYVPAEDRVVYLLGGGNAEDLMAGLRSAALHRFPVVEVRAAIGDGPRDVTLRLRNISAEEVGGIVRMGIAGEVGGGGAARVLAEKRVVPVSPGKSLEVPLECTEDVPAGAMVVVEVVTDRKGRNESEIQRTAVKVAGRKGG